MSMTREEAIELLRDTPIDIRSTREDDIHTLYATAQMMAIDALRPVSREQVEKVWGGEWILDEDDGKYQCDNCKIKFPVNYNFCPYCGSAKTEKAMQKVIGKLESLEEMKNG